MKQPRVAILILNWNGKKDTVPCLHSVKRLTYPCDLLLIDNGSTDGSVHEIRSIFPDLEILETGANLGFAEGNNEGIKIALERGADYVLLLNNDTLVDPDLIEGFLQSFQSHPEAGIVGGKIVLYDSPDLLDHWGGMWNNKKGVFDFVGLRQKASSWESSLSMDYVCGAAFMVKKEVFEKIGLLEKRFFVLWEEADFCFRAKKQGFASYTAPQAKVLHKVSVSFVGGKTHSTYFWWRNRLLWIERNCKVRAKLSLWFRVLAPEIFHLGEMYLLGLFQLFIYTLFHKEEKKNRKRKSVCQNRAALHGVRDFLLKRFGQGPAWIYNSKS